jgi:imidazoleglycerol phosphate dehydratase HisB
MNRLKLSFGKVTEKAIHTPNDFVSHMVEHIAWRMGCTIELDWRDEEWTALGRTLGGRIAGFEPCRDAAAAMGMLDDGSAEALVELGSPGGLRIDAGAGVDLEWFLSLRCEQLTSGAPLVALLTGMAQGLSAAVTVKVCNLEDPHHTWEGVFRAVGTCLSRIYSPPPEADDGHPATAVEKELDSGDIVVLRRSATGAEIRRGTAESGITAAVDFDANRPSEFCYSGPPISHYAGTCALESVGRLLEVIAAAAGLSIRIRFTAKALSSSHVLLEDSGMALGRALREVLIIRMMTAGINGGGDSLQTAEDFHHRKIRLAVSVEGRKFWRFVPLNTSPRQLQRALIIGQTVMGGIYTEDLDDFFDGLSWGLGCSIMVHIKKLPAADAAWGLIFHDLGLALKTVFEPNPLRRGVPPGVKANLS